MTPKQAPNSQRLFQAGYDAASRREPVTAAQAAVGTSSDSQRRKVLNGWWSYFRDDFKRRYNLNKDTK